MKEGRIEFFSFLKKKQKHIFSPRLVQVAQRRPYDLLDFSLVDVDARAEGRGR